MGAFWSVRFERPPPGARASRAAPAAAPGPPAPGEPLALLDLAPGTPLRTALSRLRARGGEPARAGGLLVWELPFFGAVSARQRLALYPRGGRVERVVVIVEPPGDAADPATLGRLYEELRALLLRRYGSAALVSEEGAFTGDLAGALAGGRFRRVMDWRVPGGVLRLGIPRRLDNRVRIEVALAPEQPPPRARWGAEEIP